MILDTHRLTSSMVGAVVLILAPLSAVRADTFDLVRDRVHDTMVAENLPSVVVGVARNGKILWEEGFGWADREKRIPATPHTLYALASLTKPMTTTALMVLVEQGKVSLDRPANDYLGEHKLIAHVGDAREATIRHLATHTSGLPMHCQTFNEGERMQRPPLEKSLRRYGHLMTPPGETYVYSNFGYGVLEYVIERVSGKPYGEFMQEEVFRPLGMRESSINRQPGSTNQVAERYSRVGAKVRFYDLDTRGAAAGYSSARDLLRFGMFNLKTPMADQKAILSPASLDEMHRASVQGGGPTGAWRDVGVGWLRQDEYFGTAAAVVNGGNMSGTSSILTLLPKYGVAVVVLANTTRAGLMPIETEVLRAVVPEALREHLKPKLDAGLIGCWGGDIQTYAGPIAAQLHIEDDGRVRMRVGAGEFREVTNIELGSNGNRLWIRDVPGDVRTDDAARQPYWLDFDLWRRGEALAGSVGAMARPLPDQDDNVMSYWVELKKSVIKCGDR